MTTRVTAAIRNLYKSDILENMIFAMTWLSQLQL